jgi:hypothetical protein
LREICAKWLQEDTTKPIYYPTGQCTIAPNDKLFCEVAKKQGFDIKLICQPPNYIDLNILDLDFFSSI